MVNEDDMVRVIVDYFSGIFSSSNPNPGMDVLLEFVEPKISVL